MFPLVKVPSDPKLIEVPLTVPIIPVAALSALSKKIKVLLFVLSYAAVRLLTYDVPEKTTAEPNDIDVPLIVPTMAVP